MRVRILYFFLLMLVSIFIWPQSQSIGYAQQKNEQKQVSQIIIITQQHLPHSPHPRKAERMVINCVYDAISESLQFHFLENLGGVNIIIENTTTGEYYYEMCPSTPNSCVVIVSGESGLYQIQIEDDNGHYYTGTFTLD